MDVSNVGLEAVLSQEGWDKEKVVVYFRWVLYKSEQHYFATQWEILALVRVFRFF